LDSLLLIPDNKFLYIDAYSTTDETRKNIQVNSKKIFRGIPVGSKENPFDLPTNIETVYIYDKYSLWWICKSKLCRKKLLYKLANTKKKAHNGELVTTLINRGSFGCLALSDILTTADSDYILWMIKKLGMIPGPYCYNKYGCRTDISIIKKIEMFEQFYAIGHNPDKTYFLFQNCNDFVTTIGDFCKCIAWFNNKGIGKKLVTDIPNFFEKWGFLIISTLLLYKFPINSISQIILSERHNEDKIKTISIIVQKKAMVLCSKSAYIDAINTSNIDLIGFFISINLQITLNEINYLLFDNSIENKLNFDFVCICSNMLLENCKEPIPYYNLVCGKYYDRNSYRFDGKLYDYLITHCVKIKQSIVNRSNYFKTLRHNPAGFKSIYKITPKKYDLKQQNSKINGQCPSYAINKSLIDCDNWPNCIYYHGPIEDCHKYLSCKENVYCPNRLSNCCYAHSQLKQETQEYHQIKNILGSSLTKSEVESMIKVIIANPWSCYSFIQINLETDKYVMTQVTCNAKIPELLNVFCPNKIRYAVPHDLQIKYYCCKNHMLQSEGLITKYYMREITPPE